jgi:hypothetical protein
MSNKENDINKKIPKKSTYSVEDAIKVADDVLKLGQEKKYNIGAFIHGLIFAQEYTLQSFNIPQQQIAIIKRDCRKYFRLNKNMKK